MLNVRTKGQEGEREIARKLNAIVEEVRADLLLSPLPEPAFQRNQNQTAVGGDDLSNGFGLSIEVKRQEALSVGAWWRQCCESAVRNNMVPILMFRQNRKPWRVIMYGSYPLVDNTGPVLRLRSEITLEGFLDWFERYVRSYYSEPDNLLK